MTVPSPPQHAMQNCCSGLALAVSQSEGGRSEPVRRRWAPESAKEGRGHELVQKMDLTGQMESGFSLAEGLSLSWRGGGQAHQGAPEGLVSLVGFFFFCTSCSLSLRKFLFLPCTQSLAGEDKGRRHHEWGACGRQAWGPRIIGSSAEHTLRPPP